MKFKKTMALLMSVVLLGGVFAACSKTDTSAEGTTGAGAAPSASDKSLEYIKNKGELVLGLDDQFPPMGFHDKQTNEIVGFDIDVATEVCKRMGVKLKVQPIKWDGKSMELTSKNIDCIWNGFTINDNNKKTVDFSIPYLKNRQVFVVRKDSGITKKEDLAGKVVAVQTDSSAASALDEMKDYKKTLKKVIQFDDYVTALLDLEKKSNDGILMDEVVAEYYIKSNKKENLVVLSEDVAREEYGVGFRKGDTALVEEVNQQLKAMAKDGKLAEISTKWFGQDITVVEK